MLLSSSNRNYPTFFMLSYFSVVVYLRCLLHNSLTYCIYVPGKPGIWFIIIVQLMMGTNIRIRFGLQIVLVCLYNTPSHYHYWANLSEGIESVSKIEHIHSVIHYTIYGAACFQFTHFSCDDWDILCLIIIIKSEVWTITHCFGLGHETMVSAVCLPIFFCHDIT